MQEKNKIKVLEKDNYFTTKGLNNYVGKEMIIALDMEKKLAEEILTKYCKNIITTKKIPEDDFELLNCHVYFKTNDENIILIFPDPYGRYPWEKDCLATYKKQLTYCKE